MAMPRKTRRLISFIVLAVGLSGVLMASNGNEAHSDNIPELPPETENTIAKNPIDETIENGVVMYQDGEIRKPSFTDSAFTQGPAKNLNALDFEGYFRVRFNFLHNGTLGTYHKDFGGTSMVPPSLSFLNQKSEVGDDEEAQDHNPAQNNFSANMRARINPTLHVSEIVRIKSSFDIFDNLVLGSTPTYLTQGAASSSWPTSLLSRSQNAPIYGVNTLTSAIAVKRLYGEASFPIGELRFGRMPFHWGLGILHNSGDDINNDYGDQIDGISFISRFQDIYITPTYAIAYTGPHTRGGGHFSSASNFRDVFLPGEAGQRYPLESGDITHVISLSFLKRDSDFITYKKREDRRAIFNYGLLASYRRQFLDSQAYAATETNLNVLAANVVKRESHVGLASWWSELSYGNFHIAAELAGIWGKYQIGEKDTDLLARNDDGTKINKQSVWLLQGGLAIESKYGFLNDHLQIGLDGGFASAQSGAGFGIREGEKNNPQTGDADGRKMPSTSGYKTNFKFNPGYTVDRILYREVLGGISGTAYLKPHVSYFFSRNFGVRGDVLTAIAPKKSNTTGNSNWLGLELDASSFLRTENGFYFQFAYGILFPFKGLDHQKTQRISAQQYSRYGSAKVAQTVQGMFGITF